MANNGILYAFFGGAAVIALGATYGVLQILDELNAQERESTKQVHTVKVVLASRTLHQGVQITSDDLVVRDLPPEYLPVVVPVETEDEVKEREAAGKPPPGPLRPTVINARERVVGQVPRERILVNEFIRPDRLAAAAAGLGLNATVPRGQRAISLDLRGADALTGFLEPGNFVDVLVTMEDAKGVERTRTLLQAVFVLGVNSRAANETQVEVERRGRQRPSVTLLVSPTQAEELSLSAELGELSLSLRNVQDANFQSLPGVDLDALLKRVKPKVGTIRKIVAPTSGEPVPVITIISGDSERRTTVGSTSGGIIVEDPGGSGGRRR